MKSSTHNVVVISAEAKRPAPVISIEAKLSTPLIVISSEANVSERSREILPATFVFSRQKISPLGFASVEMTVDKLALSRNDKDTPFTVISSEPAHLLVISSEPAHLLVISSEHTPFTVISSEAKRSREILPATFVFSRQKISPLGFASVEMTKEQNNLGRNDKGQAGGRSKYQSKPCLQTR